MSASRPKGWLLAALLLAACAPPQPVVPPQPAAPAPAAAVPAEPPRAATPPPRVAIPATRPLTPLDAYKQQVAAHIVSVSESTFDGRLPLMLRSIVVLEITVDRDGKAARAVVKRSNGYTELERVAVASVEKARPLPPPARDVLKGARSVSFYETWLFRDDGRFRIRSLVDDPTQSEEPAPAGDKG